MAKEGKDKVVNATIGALLDDEGKVIVLSSVDEVFKTLTPDEYAQYSPIGGTPDFKEAVKKDVFRNIYILNTSFSIIYIAHPRTLSA